MRRIDTSEWKEFRLGELFDIKKGTRLTKANMKPGNINYVGATAFNNGVTAKIGNTEHLHPADTLSVCYNGSIGQTFYQTEPFWATDDVNVLYPRFTINRYIAQFIASIIFQIGQKYDYKDKWTTDKMQKTSILLPATPSGEPDWVYMENYMCKYEQQTNTSITALKHLTETHKPKRIDTSNWKEFTLKELGFENYHGKRLTKAERKDGNTPFITAGKENQGIIGTIGNNWPTYINSITVDMFGNVFYHQGELAGDDNIYFFINDTLNEYVKLFIVVSLQSVIKSSFEYRDQFRQDNADNAKVYLPVSSSGEPDWNLMEQYMRQVELQVKNSILALTTPTPQVQQTPSNLVNYGTVNIYEK